MIGYHVFDSKTNQYVDFFDEFEGFSIPVYDYRCIEPHSLNHCIYILLMGDIKNLNRFKIIDKSKKDCIDQETYCFLYRVFEHMRKYSEMIPNSTAIFDIMHNQKYLVCCYSITIKIILEKLNLKSLQVIEYVNRGNTWIMSMSEFDYILFKLINEFENILWVYDIVKKDFVSEKKSIYR